MPVNATITAEDRSGAAEQAAEAARAGFGVVKVKVGIGDDAGRLAAVRAAVGPAVGLRVDANGAWSVPEAVAAIGSLEPVGLELVEEPVHGLENVRRVREAVAARVAIDETSAEPGALGAGAADAVCLKLSRCGGISGALAAGAEVRASGAEVYLTSSLDGPVGVAGALHAAAALASTGPLAHCGLATLALFEDLEDPLPGARRGDRGARPVRGWESRRARPRTRRARRRRARPRASSTAASRSAALERQRVAAVEDVEPCARDQLGQPAGDRQELLVARSGDHLDRASAAPPSRPHRESISPVPTPRSTRASDAGLLRRWSASASSRTCSGLAREQRLGAPALDELLVRARLELLGQALDRPGGARSRSTGSSMPAVVDTSTSRCTRAGAVSAGSRAIRPPSE